LQELPQTKLLARESLETHLYKEFVDSLNNKVSDDKNCDCFAAGEIVLKQILVKPDETEDDWKKYRAKRDRLRHPNFTKFIYRAWDCLREAQAQGGEWDLKQFITPEGVPLGLLISLMRKTSMKKAASFAAWSWL